MSENTGAKNVYTTTTGIEVHIKKVPPMLLQKVLNGTEMPKRPTYETRTISGRVEVFPMDAISAKQTENGETLWEYYQEQLGKAQAVQNERVTMTAFLFGADCEIPENGWDKMQEFVGIEVPPIDKPEFRRAHYLATELPADDIKILLEKIMSTVQVSEESIREAEDSF